MANNGQSSQVQQIKHSLKDFRVEAANVVAKEIIAGKPASLNYQQVLIHYRSVAVNPAWRSVLLAEEEEFKEDIDRLSRDAKDRLEEACRNSQEETFWSHLADSCGRFLRILEGLEQLTPGFTKRVWDNRQEILNIMHGELEALLFHDRLLSKLTTSFVPCSTDPINVNKLGTNLFKSKENDLVILSVLGARALGLRAIEEFLANPTHIVKSNEEEREASFRPLEIVTQRFGTLLGVQQDENSHMSINWEGKPRRRSPSSPLNDRPQRHSLTSPRSPDPRFVPRRRSYSQV
ncbi:uncharacterized protein JCM6883_006650 [Sporobolomyces salmoneus]|uniref:uncharacterized protein n=1 Tax=Sporobolomyces salmoneus TaxID=183962 RepID=UPI0031825697